MIRGIITFKCDKCGTLFRAPDAEWCATIFSAPMKCPNCGSYHTLPNGLFGTSAQRPFYEKIWEQLDESGKEPYEVYTVGDDDDEEQPDGSHQTTDGAPQQTVFQRTRSRLKDFFRRLKNIKE